MSRPIVLHPTPASAARACRSHLRWAGAGIALAAVALTGASCTATSAQTDRVTAATSAVPASGLPYRGGDASGRPVRFVLLTPDDSGPVDLVEGNDGSGTRLAVGVQPGHVTDYLPYGPDGIAIVDRDGQVVLRPAAPSPALARSTVVVGKDANGAYTAETLSEVDGRSADDAGLARPDHADRVRLLADGYGFGPSVQSQGEQIRLARTTGDCLPADGDDPDHPEEGGHGIALDSSVVGYDVAPTEHSLLWVAGVGCDIAQSAPLDVTLTAGSEAYVLPWLATGGRIQTVFVPITVAGAGTAGVETSDPGPTYRSTTADDTSDATG